MELLQCYSWGNHDFSAFYALMGCGLSLEYMYQSSKRNALGKTYPSPKGIIPELLAINRTYHPYSNTLRHDLYNALWFLYFCENPNLYKEACSFDGFYERYPRDAYTPMAGTFANKPFESSRGCDQSLTIAWLVFNKHTLASNLFSPLVLEALQNYWGRNHDGPMPIAHI